MAAVESRRGLSRRDHRVRRRVPGAAPSRPRADGPRGRSVRPRYRSSPPWSRLAELFERAAAGGATRARRRRPSWDRDRRTIDDVMRRRLVALFAVDLNLAADHPALDADPEVGKRAALPRAGDRCSPAASPESERRPPVRALLPRGASGTGGTGLGRAPLVFASGPERIERVVVARRRGGESARGRGGGIPPPRDGEPAEPSMMSAREAGLHSAAAAITDRDAGRAGALRADAKRFGARLGTSTRRIPSDVFADRRRRGAVKLRPWRRWSRASRCSRAGSGRRVSPARSGSWCSPPGWARWRPRPLPAGCSPPTSALDHRVGEHHRADPDPPSLGHRPAARSSSPP